MTDQFFSMSGLSVVATGFGTTTTLVDGIDLSLKKGEVLGLIGESGAGKTTIGLAALAYTRPNCTITEGEICFSGQDLRTVSRRSRREHRGRRIAYVAQSAAASFNPVKTILQQACEMPIRHGLMTYAEAKEHVIKLFRELGLPTPETFGDRYPFEVSGGQLQRAMLAMAMSCNPDIIVFDEPTTALDVTTQIEVLATIGKMIRDHNTAGLYISHDLAVVAQVAHRIMVLRHGQMVEVGETGQILENPKEDYTRELVSVRARSAHVQPKDAATTKQVLLELTEVTAVFGAMKAVNGASFQVCKGETVAIVGESGSGKSTLARVICGLHPPVGGTVKFKGEILPQKLRLRSHNVLRQIQLIYQQPDIALNPRQRVKDIIGRPLSLYFNLKGEQLHARILELLRLTELPADALMRWPGELSGGQKQRVCIARALAAEPDLLVCDEITSALDPLVAEEILCLLERLQENTGIAYLYITHDFGTVRRLADRVVVMLRGDIVAKGDTTEVFSPPCHPYVQTLLSSIPEMRTDWLSDALQDRQWEETGQITRP